MRPSLLPNLLAAAARNLARGHSGFALSEVGHAYAGDQPKDETLACRRLSPGRGGVAAMAGWGPRG